MEHDIFYESVYIILYMILDYTGYYFGVIEHNIIYCSENKIFYFFRRLVKKIWRTK